MSKGLSYKYSGTKGHIIATIGSLPINPNKLLAQGWEDVTHPQQKKQGHLEFKETATGLKIRFDKKVPGAKGFKSIDHYHVYNPHATGKKDLYLDKNANPVRRGAGKSHILPKGDEQ